MLDPDVVLSTLVLSFRSIPALVAEMGGDALAISGHTYLYGPERSLAQSIYEQRSPSILIAYIDMIGGQFSGEGVWKHRLEAYIRPKNASTGLVSGLTPASSPPHLFYLMFHSAVPYIYPGTLNLRTVRMLPDLAPLDAMPSLTHQADEQGADLFRVSMTFPELGDV
jgi:hypothetical protein